MPNKSVSSSTNVMELFTIMLVMLCGVLATIAFLSVLNVYQHGWSGALPLLATVAGLIYIGRDFDDPLTLRELPGSQFAMSVAVGLMLGVGALAAKQFLLK